MGELSEIAKELNLPKQLLDKGEKVIKAVLGPSVSQISETFADNFRLRRFKNQIKILTKAQEHIEKLGFDPKQVNLKVLAPLVQLSSLEENIELQERWAKLITNIVKIEGQTLLKQNSIEIISKISNEEAQLIDFLYDYFIQKRLKRFQNDNRTPSLYPSIKKKELEDYPLKWFSFLLTDISKKRKISIAELELMISNLTTLGVIKWDPEVEVYNAEKSYTDPEDTSLDIDIEVYDSETIKLTNLGFEFVKICRLKK
ncbi:Abi-alpha family protein [uncultured Tenacibaculum sp.]|uniref:Abi-alpha family protein n=1 Tax=uncultured Tenacibaculum sp. TaxID=174713 RepID=UPI002619C15B|nr:Abi-alpha family protein [uncultured Tenacibaculum sp.]